MAERSLVTPEFRDRVRARAAPIAVALGRLGLTPDALTYRIIDISAYANTHVIFLEDLAPGTTYYLKVVARDETGRLHESVVIEKATKTLQEPI